MNSKVLNSLFGDVTIRTRTVSKEGKGKCDANSFKKRMKAMRYFRENTAGCHRKNEDRRFKCYANDLCRSIAREDIGVDCRDNAIDALIDWQTIPELCMLDIAGDKNYFNKNLKHAMLSFDGLEDLEQEVVIDASKVTMGTTNRQMASTVALKYFEEFYKYYKKRTSKLHIHDNVHTCTVYVLTPDKLYSVDITANVKG